MHYLTHFNLGCSNYFAEVMMIQESAIELDLPMKT
jgi:hypothetical protein